MGSVSRQWTCGSKAAKKQGRSPIFGGQPKNDRSKPDDDQEADDADDDGLDDERELAVARQPGEGAHVGSDSEWASDSPSSSSSSSSSEEGRA